MEASQSDTYQVFVKLLDGKHRVFNFETPSISVSNLKDRIQTLISIPSHLQLLLSSDSRVLYDHQTLAFTQSTQNPDFPNSRSQLPQDQFCDNGVGKFPLVVHLLVRLRGGKGGFGSLLRGAATKAGQKKTNNFDACRDMSGRRLRHVNAEKKLEEWRADAEERKLEKMAEDFLKKKAKEVAKSGKRNGSDSAEKYVAKYREQSAKCMEEVEKSVLESVKESLRSKRKGGGDGSESDAKRLKIWLGKRKFGDSDDEDDSDEDEGENEKSVVIDNGSHSDSSKEADESLGSVTGEKLETGLLHQGSSGISSEEEDIGGEKFENFVGSLGGSIDAVKSITADNPATESLEGNNDHAGVDADSKLEEITSQLPGVSDTKLEVASSAELSSSAKSQHLQDESATAVVEVQDLDKPLNFDDYHLAAELEVIGMERLKSELQSRGLKCGGTLQERAARLFLLKTTPLDMLPKKLFAKK